MPDAHKNFAVSTVATAPSPASSGTSLVVASGHGARFPAVPFNATVWPAGSQPDPSNAEIVRVTATSTDTFSTIVRAQEGSSARTVVVGDQIAATVTAKTLTDAEVETSLIWNAAGDLLIGSGADAGTILARGTPGQRLVPDATTIAWVNDPLLALAPSGAVAENYNRYLAGNALAGTSGTLRMAAIWLPKGLVVTAINVVCGATAEAGGSHAWGALYDSSRALLRQSADETGAAAIAASVPHAFTLTSTFTTTYAGLHYVGILTVATTMPNFISAGASGNAIASGVAPVLAGSSTTGISSGTAPDPAGAITAATSPFYTYLT